MIYEIDPLEDPRWSRLLDRHPDSSVFHTRAWLATIRDTYGHEPAVLTTTGPGKELENGLVFCRVRSWLTGNRLVSLPFSDHCEPLAGSASEAAELFSGLEACAKAGHFRYVQVRPVSTIAGWNPSDRYYLHRLDLRPGPGALFQSLHEGCIRRRIRHAEKCGVTVRTGRDADLLAAFYKLVVETRRRHGLPPQPIAWFRNLLANGAGPATIYCGYKDEKAVAAILTLRFGKVAYYKYGASAAQFHALGAVPYVLWRSIEDAIRDGCREFDMGRSGPEDRGLVTFKDRWNASRTDLAYLNYAPGGPRVKHWRGIRPDLFSKAVRHMPALCLTTLGTVGYRHID